uniref:Putative secreted protein n=1 Tax=Ixodes ricinus TaxID=34613 RepID=A0A6B0TVN7_IXORI
MLQRPPSSALMLLACLGRSAESSKGPKRRFGDMPFIRKTRVSFKKKWKGYVRNSTSAPRPARARLSRRLRKSKKKRSF